MSRLIDADRFIEYLGLNEENSREENLGEIVTLEDFDAQPTAYDPDKVAERLKYNIIGQLGEDGLIRIPLDKAIEIVKGGGVDE